MPPTRGRGRGRGRQAKPATPKKGSSSEVAGNKKKRLSEESTDETAKEDTVEEKTSKKDSNVTEDNPVDSTKDGTAVTLQSPEETAEEITDIAKVAEDDSTNKAITVTMETPEETAEEVTDIVKDTAEDATKVETLVTMETAEETTVEVTNIVKDAAEETAVTMETAEETTVEVTNIVKDAAEETTKEETTVTMETPQETSEKVPDIAKGAPEETTKGETKGILETPQETLEEVPDIAKEAPEETTKGETTGILETPQETSEEVPDIAKEAPEETTNGETTVTLETPQETSEVVPDIAKEAPEETTNEEKGDNNDISEERNRGYTAEVTQDMTEETEAVMETTEDVTGGLTDEVTDHTLAETCLNDIKTEEDFEDMVIEDIDISEEMAEFDEEIAETSNIDEEERNVTIKSEIDVELGDDVEMETDEEGDKEILKKAAPAFKDFKIEITKRSNLKPVKYSVIHDMYKGSCWKCSYHRVKLSKVSTRRFVERLNDLEKKTVSFVSCRRDHNLPTHVKGFLTFNTYEQRAKAASVFEPLIQKTATRFEMKPFIRPSTEMAMMSANGDNCLHLNNVPETTMSKQLKAIFPQADEIIVPAATSGKSSGYAVLFFKTKVDADAVQKYNKEVMIGNSVLSLQKMFISKAAPTEITKGAPSTKTTVNKIEKSVPHSAAKQVKKNPSSEKKPKKKVVSENVTGQKVAHGKLTGTAKGGQAKPSGPGQKNVPRKQTGPGTTSSQQKQPASGIKGAPQKKPAPGIRGAPQKQPAPGIRGAPQKQPAPGKRGGQKQSGLPNQRGQQQKGGSPKSGPQGQTGSRQRSGQQNRQQSQQWQKGQGPKVGPPGKTRPGQHGGPQMQNRQQGGHQWQKEQGSKGGSQGNRGQGQHRGPQMQNKQQEGQQWQKGQGPNGGSQRKTGPGQRSGPQTRNRQQGGQQRQMGQHPFNHRSQADSGGARKPTSLMGNFVSGGREKFSPTRGSLSQRSDQTRNVKESFPSTKSDSQPYRRERQLSGGAKGYDARPPSTYESSRDRSGGDTYGGANRDRNYSGRQEGPSSSSRQSYERGRAATTSARPAVATVDRGDIDKLQGIMKQQLLKMKQQMEQNLKKQLKDQLKNELRDIQAAGKKRKQQELANQMSQNAGKRPRVAEKSYYTEDTEDDLYGRRPVNISPRGSGGRAPRLYDRSPESTRLDRPYPDTAGYDSPPRRSRSSFDRDIDIGEGVPMQVFNYNNKSMNSSSASMNRRDHFTSGSPTFMEDIRYPLGSAIRRPQSPGGPLRRPPSPGGPLRRPPSPGGIQITRRFDDYVSPLDRMNHRPPPLADDYYSDYMGSHTGGYH